MIQWCTHHKDDPPPPEDDENKEKRTDDIPVWDQEFLKVDQGTLFELILVSVLKKCKDCACEVKLSCALEKKKAFMLLELLFLWERACGEGRWFW